MKKFVATSFIGSLLVLFLTISLMPNAMVTPQSQITKNPSIQQIHPLDNMPLVRGGMSVAYTETGVAPIEERSEIYKKWLSPSVKISVSGASGSGTIVYYDSYSNTAYVATCGHLWDYGKMSAEEGRKRNLTCKVIVWYQNEKKLETTKVYEARVLFYNNLTGADTALIAFQPDWIPTYFPIAPKDYEYKKGSRMHSCGCDGGREVAHYDVEIIGIQGDNLVTFRNSPRPGRSGGGLMDDEYYIATCWGTESYSGDGKGFFTPLSVIHEIFSKNGYDFLLRIPPGGSVARSLPIVDRNGSQKEYPIEYILLPGIK